MIYAAAAAIAVILLVLAWWQGRVERQERSRVVEEIREARSLGADQPVGQYPHIDPLRCIGCASCARACPESGVLGLVDGIAHVVSASRCIGHARCEEACPVGAIEVGLGDLRDRADIPQLSEALETTVPGIYVAGELGGLALIRNAVEQGVRTIDAIAARARPSAGDETDVLIVGAGPAGLAASLRAVERGLRHVTIDRGDVGGSIRKYPRRKLVMTQPVALPLHGRLRRLEYRKEELVDLWEGVIREHDIGVRTGVSLLGAERRDGRLVARTDAGEIACRHIVLALGRRGTPRRLGVPGEELEHVLYQLIDAATYADQRLLVVGGGDSAVEAAMALADQPGNVVWLSYRRPALFRLKQRNRERIEGYFATERIRPLFSSQVEHIEPGHVDLTTDDGPFRVPNDYVFVLAGGEPPYPLLRQLGVGFWKEPAA